MVGLVAESFDFPSRHFQPRVYGVGAWTDNLHFAYDAVAALRPRLLVELGTDRGESYFAFCQSVAENQTETRCFAIDTWRGDEHAGGYDETTFAEVSAENNKHYAGFSTLRRSTFTDAVAAFPNESIDLLHLDGLHTEKAVRGDLETWLPKLCPGGLLLLHDVSVRARNFGVWRVWEELQTRGRHYTFLDGPGLGVWQKPPATPLPEPLASLFEGDPATADYYRTRAREVQARIARDWQDGSIRLTTAGQQTIVQIFHTRDGVHREVDSVVARIGHRAWKEIAIPLPPEAGLVPLRIDFLSAFTTIEIASLRIVQATGDLFAARGPTEFEQITIAGDAERLPHPEYLKLRITGVDPQLHLPSLPSATGDTKVLLRLRVHPAA